jgi:hypothetical protein
MMYIIFLLLQVLDFMTTMVGLAYGLTEVNPILRWVGSQVPSIYEALLYQKLTMIAIGTVVYSYRPRVIEWSNYFFLALVLWNFVMLGQLLR